MTDPRAVAPVAEVVADLLAQAGVRRAYTVPGESFLPLIEAIASHPQLRLISTRHESGAAFMAEADGKLTGQPAVVMATRAVGAANLSIGLHTARQDSTPMLALLGQVETEHLGKEAFQEVDLPAFLDEVTVSATTVTRADRVASEVARALVSATSGRPGPAAVALPSDVLEGKAPTQSPLVSAPPRPAASAADVDAVARLLAEAKRPVAIAGQGSDHATLTAFAEAYGVGMYAAFRRQDCFPNDHEHYLGHLTLGTAAPVLESLRQADLVLVLGERLDEVTTQTYQLPSERSRLVHVHRDPAVLGRHQRVDLALVADSTDLCRRLVELAPGAARSARPSSAGPGSTAGSGPDSAAGTGWWRAGHAAYLDAARSAGLPDPDGRLHPGRAISAVLDAAPKGTVVANDAGNFSVFLHRQWAFHEPRTQAAPVSGAMGYAVPGAIGAALARPDRPVLGVAGDGGFLMTAHELETATRLGVGIKMLVLQNGLYGTIAMHQARSGLSVSGCDIGAADLAGLARSLGAKAWECTAESQLADAAAELMRQDGPAVMVVRTHPDVIAPGTSLAGLRGNSSDRSTS